MGCKSERKAPPLYTGCAFDVLYFINDDVDTFRVEGKYQFMTEQRVKSYFKEKSDWLRGRPPLTVGGKYQIITVVHHRATA